MRITWGRRRTDAPAPAAQGCGHTRIEPMSTTYKQPRDSSRYDFSLIPHTDAMLNALCMDCGKPVEFEMGRVGGKPSDIENWTRVMRANGYMQNAANNALWEKVV